VRTPSSPLDPTDSRVVALALVGLLLLVLVGNSATDHGTDNADLSQNPVATNVDTPAPPGDIGTAAWATTLLEGLSTTTGTAPVRYERDDYDGWDDADNDCQSARHEVLIAESNTPVEFTDSNDCKVTAGNWIDPYTGGTMTEAANASIDHVVSLANAHHSGAWQWPTATKRAFGNDIADPATLAVSEPSVNGSKGSASPDQWMPQALDARCDYGVAWVRVKARWELGVTAPEREALHNQLDECEANDLPASPETAPFAIADALTEFEPDDINPTDTRPVVQTQPQAVMPAADDDPSTCDDHYAVACIPEATTDLDCADIAPRRFKVDSDPHNFDGDNDGIGCEDP